MLILHDAYRSSDLPRGGVATIGNYDGIHRGQRAILERVVARARERDLNATVVTFDPHPLAVLRPGEEPPLLTTRRQKQHLLEQLGLDVALFVRFDEEFARTTAREFVGDFLHRRLGVREVHVGEDFLFGHRREGDLELLREMGEELGFAVYGAEPVLHGGRRISSTGVRRALGQGAIEEANAMLGRPYAITGRVVRGDRMGKRLGWPTANLQPDNELLLANGVYAGRVSLASFPATFACATNVGTRPTVYENYQRVVESHILDFSTDIYGESLELEFHRRLREERIFPTVTDLAAQIGRDVEAVREYFAVRSGL